MEENRTEGCVERGIGGRKTSDRSKSKLNAKSSVSRARTLDKTVMRVPSNTGPSTINSSKVDQKKPPIRRTQPSKTAFGRAPPKTAKEAPEREERYIGNVGAFSRLEQPSGRNVKAESPYLRSDTTKASLNTKSSGQNYQKMPQIGSKAKTAKACDRKPASHTVTVGNRLVEALPYGMQGSTQNNGKHNGKDSKPLVIPKGDISDQEISDLYRRSEFYIFEAFFGIEPADSPFARIDNDEDNFSIDVISNHLVSRA